MKIHINGEEVRFDKEISVTALLTEHDVKMPEMVSVELNGEILSRSAFDNTIVKDGDNIEFLYFMGGGQSAHTGEQS